MQAQLKAPDWYAKEAAPKQALLRKWQKVATTGATKRGNGWRVGGTHHNAKLTDHDVELIRQLHEGGMKCSEIARKFECSRQNISKIVNYDSRIQVGMGVNQVFE